PKIRDHPRSHSRPLCPNEKPQRTGAVQKLRPFVAPKLGVLAPASWTAAVPCRFGFQRQRFAITHDLTHVLGVRTKSARGLAQSKSFARSSPQSWAFSRPRPGPRQSPAALDFSAKDSRHPRSHSRPWCLNEKRQGTGAVQKL